MVPTLCMWQRKKHGVYLSNLVVESEGPLSGSKGDTAAWVNNSAFADDLLLIAQSEKELSSIYHDLVAAIAVKAFHLRENMQLWSNLPGEPATFGRRRLLVSASVVFLGALL